MGISNFFSETISPLCFFRTSVYDSPFNSFSVFVFDFSGDVPSKPALNELHKPPIIKGNNFKIKHGIKLEILLFSIVKLDTSFYCVCVPTIIINI